MEAYFEEDKIYFSHNDYKKLPTLEPFGTIIPYSILQEYNDSEEVYKIPSIMYGGKELMKDLNIIPINYTDIITNDFTLEEIIGINEIPIVGERTGNITEICGDYFITDENDYNHIIRNGGYIDLEWIAKVGILKLHEQCVSNNIELFTIICDNVYLNLKTMLVGIEKE
jgi:hypothetical protein